MKVLHVVEALGGGVTSALREYISSTSGDVENVVAARTRPTHDTGDDVGAPIVERLPGVGSPFDMVRAIRRAVRRTRPDIVHAHSSWAGGYARVTPFVPTDRLVYTPHCYAFERTDLLPSRRATLHRAEKLLARRLGGVAAVSPREAELARSLGTHRVAYVPQVVSMPAWANSARQASQDVPGERAPRYVIAGRICPQKDPDFFADVARRLLRSIPGSRVLWLGGGSPEDENRLRAAGVEVTGWIDRSTLLQELAKADVYVHTAAWEGSPMTILEATSLGVPVVARRIPALESIGVELMNSSPSDLAETAEEAAKNPGTSEGLDLLSTHHREVQRTALLGLYDRVVNGAR